MNDLISRQEAINLLKDWSGGYDYIEIETEAAIKEFQQLPSAQPEITEKQVKEYCKKRCLIVLSSDAFHRLKSAQPEITAEQVKEYCEERGWVVLTKEEYHWLKSLHDNSRINGGGKLLNNIIYGSKIRARKVYGHRGWLVYKLLDPDKQDRAGNRSVIDYARTRKDAIDYIYNLDEIGVLQHGKDKLSEY